MWFRFNCIVKIIPIRTTIAKRKRINYLTIKFANLPIVVNLDVMMARRKMSLTELSERVGITMANMSILKTGKAKAIRFDTLDLICQILECQPGDLLEFVTEAEYNKLYP
jgi:putative transcriptional regulator